MNIRFRSLLSAIMLICLAACGGGGGGSTPGGPVVTPPTTKPPVYSVRVKFVGGDSLHATAQAIMHPLQRTYQAYPLSTGTGSTQLPVEISVIPPSSDILSQAGSFGTAIVQINPQPSSAPPVAISASGVNVTVNPEPTPSSAPTTPPQFSVQSETTTTQTGTLTATVGGSVNQTQSIPTYVINRAVLACGGNTIPGQNGNASYDNWGGIKFVGGVAQQATSMTDADLYVQGPDCTTDGFTGSTSDQIVAPHGMTFISSTQTPFATLATSACTGAQPSITIKDFDTALLDPSVPKDIACVNTGEGHPAKLAIAAISGNFGDTSIIFNYEEDGSAPDGF